MPHTPAGPTPRTIESEWERLHSDRTAALNRKRQHSELTINNILPPAGQAQHQDLAVPYNSMPAEGINNLAARLVAVILPLNNLPVFELFVDEKFNPEGEDMSQQNTVLRRVENAVMNRLYITNLRPQMFVAMKHLITVGDVLMFMLPDLDIRLYRADEYVVRRTTEGVWREIIIREMVDPDLNPDLHDIEPTLAPFSGGSGGTEGFPRSSGQSRTFEPLYTKVTRAGEGKVCKVEREFRGAKVDLKGNDEFEVSPYMPLRWNAVTGEDYGTSLVEDAFGDIRSLDLTTAGLLDGIAMASEFRWGINTSGIAEIEDFRQSVNGDAVAMGKDDIEPLNFGNAQQISSILAVRQHQETRLGRRFLMNSAVQPTGDRVTAKQVTILAEELEQALGGVLSMVNRDIMIPMIRRALFVLSETDDGIFPAEFGQIIKEIDGVLKLRIRAGLELLQREADREKMLEWLQIAVQLPEQAQRVYKWEAIGRDIFLFSGLEPEGRVKTAEELAAEDEAAMQQQQALMAQEAAQQAAIRSVPQGGEGVQQ